MLDRLGAAARAGRITARLRQLSTLQVDILRRHYGTGSLPFGVDPCASLLARARRLCGVVGAVGAEVLRAGLLGASEAERTALAVEADALVEQARSAYDGLRVDPVDRVQVHDPRPWRR